MIAKDIMTTNVVSVRVDTPVVDVARLMATHNVSGVPVVDAGSRVVGVVSENDLLLKHDKAKSPHRLALFGFWVVPEESLVEAYEDARGGTVAADVMTKKAVTFEEDADITQIAETMVKKNINRVPIVRDGKLVGIVSRADIVKSIAGIDED